MILILSFSTVTGICFFDKGITIADFHNVGSTFTLSELLNIAVTCAARRCELSFSTNDGTLFRPLAVFTLILSSATLVSLMLMVHLAGSGSLMLKIGCVARRFVMFSDTNIVEHNALLTQCV